MSRRIVIGILIVLILGVLGGTIALIVARLNKPTEVVQTPPMNTLPGANTGGQQVVDPTGDLDGDGLSNSDEKLWGTNPNNSDTDGDGFKDGEEVSANHNPTIPSPNDKLPAGFTPGQNITPLEGAAPATQSFESFFADNVDLTGGKTNLTQEYGRTVPDKDKTPVTFSQFISAQSIVTTLPRVNESLITPEQDIPLALSQYLSTAGDIDPISDKTRLSLALTDLLNDHNASGFHTLAARVSTYQETIKRLRVPPQALQYQKLLLGYSELLRASFQQVANYDQDQVKALVALRQIEAIDRRYYPLIIQERSRLVGLAP